MSGKVFLWAPPRALSTAFARAIQNLDDCKVFVEPYRLAHVFGSGTRPHQGLEGQPPDKLLTFQETTDMMCQHYDGKSKVFCKEIAKYLHENLHELESEKLREFQHTFILRHPEKTIPSLYRAIRSILPEWKNFDLCYESGFRQLYNLYEFIYKKSDNPPVIILADDLLKDPESVLKYYCDHTGLTYKEGMSRWEPGAVDGWEPERFFQSVFNSSGIGQLNKPSHHSKEELPEIVKEAVESSVWFFEQLYDKRVRF